MLCEECGQNEATIFLTEIVHGVTTTRNLCTQCGGTVEEIRAKYEAMKTASAGLMAALSPVSKAAVANPDYPEGAYTFVYLGVKRAIEQTGGQRHVTAAEVLQVLRDLARKYFGTAARSKLRLLNITRCEDFGEIVFALIEQGVFSKRPEDKKEDFSHGYDFAEAFPEQEG